MSHRSQVLGLLRRLVPSPQATASIASPPNKATRLGRQLWETAARWIGSSHPSSPQCSLRLLALGSSFTPIKFNPSQGIKVHETKRAGIDCRQPGQPHPPLLPGFRAGLLAKLRPSWPCSWSHLNQQLSMRWESENLKGPQRSLRSGPKVHRRKNPELRGILGPWEERGWE